MVGYNSPDIFTGKVSEELLIRRNYSIVTLQKTSGTFKRLEFIGMTYFNLPMER